MITSKSLVYFFIPKSIHFLGYLPKVLCDNSYLFRYTTHVDQFALQLQKARSRMSSGQYKEAFDLIVDQEVQNLSSLLKKIECLIDIGFILRDEKILKYGLYLLDKHGSEVLEVEDLAPFYFLNLANQLVNMVTLSSYSDEYFGYYQRKELLRARECYEKALSYENLSEDLAYRIHLGLGRILQISGRGIEALSHYQAALKYKPDDPEVLIEKIRLMTTYARLNGSNSRELLKEAWHLSYRIDEEDSPQEGLVLRKQILELVSDREFLEAEEEYPRHSIVTNSEKEHEYTMFSLRHSLYLNLCGFCRKCDFAAGDRARFSSGSLTIHPQQKKRYISLSVSFARLSELYRTGRFLLIDGISDNSDRNYADPGGNRPGVAGYATGTMEYYLLRNAFLHGWSLWEAVKEYLEIFWDRQIPGCESLMDFFHKQGKIRSVWEEIRSPAFHAVYDLYLDCMTGSLQYLLSTFRELSRPLKNGSAIMEVQDLRKKTLKLYSVLRQVILYLGTLHERNEYQDASWDFPRPLYNFINTEM